jgi:diacylglycerol kinase (ATP)
VKVKILLNPYANRWRAKTRLSTIEAACQAAGLDFDLTLLPGPGQGRDLALLASADGYDAVVAAGGDGTVNEVINGLIASAGDRPTMPLGIVPIGTGNDLNDMAGLPRDITQAVQIIAQGHTRQIDAGRVVADDRVHYFGNNCAAAMEPMVTIENIRMTRLSGNIRYIAALIKALLRLKAWQMRITWDEGGYEGPAILLSVCNSPRTGGLFRMAPQALLDDGLFDFVVAPDLPMRTILSLLPKLLKGSHVLHPMVTYGRTTSLTIESEPGTPLHADGEVFTESANHVVYEMLPKKITLLTAKT